MCYGTDISTCNLEYHCLEDGGDKKNQIRDAQIKCSFFARDVYAFNVRAEFNVAHNGQP